MNEAGTLASSHGAGTATLASDDTCWHTVNGGFVNAVDANCRIDQDNLAQQGLTVVKGPLQLPSEHLTELREHGYTIVENILEPDAIAQLKTLIAKNRAEKHAEEPEHDGHFWMMDGISWAPELARASVHPVALWLIQQYMSTDDIHFCHQPIITTLRPAKALSGTFPEAGWHSDYPYHPGVFPDNYWPQSPVFGVQYNVCLDEFRTNNAATQFVPGSHRLCKGPPIEFNTGGTRMGKGQHKEVAQFCAQAGAGLIYDARTWHRACHELNASGEDRIAFLNAVAPDWIRPMIDKAPVGELYAASEVPTELSARERSEVDRLCNSETRETPAGMPQLLERSRRR